MKRTRVLIVEENKKIQLLLAELLGSDGAVNVLPAAENLDVAREQLETCGVDVLILNARMAYPGEQSFVETVLMESPLPIVVTSRLDAKAMDDAARALCDGAYDSIILPPSLDDPDTVETLKVALRTKIMDAARTQIMPNERRKNPRILHFKAKRVGLPVIAIGGSTGVVAALRQLLAPLPTITPPIVMALHIPGPLIRNVVRQLNPKTEITFVEATDGAPLQNGYAYIAPEGQCLTVRRLGAELVCQLEAITSSRGAIDRLFYSVATMATTNAVGLLLSGNGDDGAKGLAEIKSKGGYTIVQDETTSIASELPLLAIQLHKPSAILPLSEIAKHMLDHSQIGKRRSPATTRRNYPKA